jgi:hypothetical protein
LVPISRATQTRRGDPGELVERSLAIGGWTEATAKNRPPLAFAIACRSRSMSLSTRCANVCFAASSLTACNAACRAGNANWVIASFISAAASVSASVAVSVSRWQSADTSPICSSPRCRGRLASSSPRSIVQLGVQTEYRPAVLARRVTMRRRSSLYGSMGPGRSTRTSAAADTSSMTSGATIVAIAELADGSVMLAGWLPAPCSGMQRAGRALAPDARWTPASQIAVASYWTRSTACCLDLL